MSDYATKKDVKEAVNAAVGKIGDLIKQFASRVGERFNEVNQRIDSLDKKYERHITTLNSFIKRLDDIATDNIARDAQ